MEQGGRCPPDSNTEGPVRMTGPSAFGMHRDYGGLSEAYVSLPSSKWHTEGLLPFPMQSAVFERMTRRPGTLVVAERHGRIRLDTGALAALVPVPWLRASIGWFAHASGSCRTRWAPSQFAEPGRARRRYGRLIGMAWTHATTGVRWRRPLGHRLRFGVRRLGTGPPWTWRCSPQV